MRLKTGLLFWMLRRMRNIIWVTGPVAAVHSLLAPGYMTFKSPWPVLFIFGHSIAMAVSVGRFRTGQFGFLYSRGYSRDTLWVHAMLASAIGAVAAWLPASLVIWLGIRSFIQDLLQSPFYPVIMEPRDAMVPWLWLVLYVILLPILHYAWIREGYAAWGEKVGRIFMVVLAVSAMPFLVLDPPFSGFFTIILLVGGLVSIMVLIASRLVHRSLEVQG